MWYNVTPSELQGAKGEVVNGLYFYEDGNVSMKTAVVSDTTIIAKPILTGWGTYSHSGTIKKGIRLKINTAFKLDEKAVDYDGIITKNGMLLYASDSTATFYSLKQSRIGIVISASHSCGAELSLLRLKGLPEPVLYDRISTLRFLFITALLEL